MEALGRMRTLRSETILRSIVVIIEIAQVLHDEDKNEHLLAGKLSAIQKAEQRGVNPQIFAVPASVFVSGRFYFIYD